MPFTLVAIDSACALNIEQRNTMTIICPKSIMGQIHNTYIHTYIHTFANGLGTPSSQTPKEQTLPSKQHSLSGKHSIKHGKGNGPPSHTRNHPPLQNTTVFVN